MPSKPRVETWQTCPTPETPMQRSAFLDLCVQWLVQEPLEEDADVLETRTTLLDGVDPFAVAMPADACPIAATKVEARLLQHVPRCSLCDGDDAAGGVSIMANPCAQRSLVTLCGRCHARAAASTS